MSYHWTTISMGSLVILYTTTGGIKAVTWADVLQMGMIMGALLLALGIAISMLPADISFLDAVRSRVRRAASTRWIRTSTGTIATTRGAA